MSFQRSSLVLLFLILAHLAQGQNWVASDGNLAYRVKPGKQFVELKMKIRDGYHINSHQPENELMIPTRLEADWPAGVEAGELLFSETHEFQFEGIDQPMQVFKESFSIWIPLEVTGRLLSSKVPVRVYYQACDEKKCYFPRVAEFDILLVNGSAYISEF